MVKCPKCLDVINEQNIIGSKEAVCPKCGLIDTNKSASGILEQFGIDDKSYFIRIKYKGQEANISRAKMEKELDKIIKDTAGKNKSKLKNLLKSPSRFAESNLTQTLRQYNNLITLLYIMQLIISSECDSSEFPKISSNINFTLNKADSSGNTKELFAYIILNEEGIALYEGIPGKEEEHAINDVLLKFAKGRLYSRYPREIPAKFSEDKAAVFIIYDDLPAYIYELIENPVSEMLAKGIIDLEKLGGYDYDID